MDLQALRNATNDEVPLFSLNGTKTCGKVVDIYDGDTCTIVFFVGDKRQKFTARLLGVDTPEMKPLLSKPGRDQEIKAAKRCRNRALQLLTNCCDITLDTEMTKKECKKILDTNTKLVTVHCHDFDKYGRLLVTLYDNIGQHGGATNAETSGETSVNQRLISEGHAKAYDGGTKNEFTYKN